MSKEKKVGVKRKARASAKTKERKQTKPNLDGVKISKMDGCVCVFIPKSVTDEYDFHYVKQAVEEEVIKKGHKVKGTFRSSPMADGTQRFDFDEG